MTTMPAQTWVYRGRLVRVVDGDTCDVELDAGMHIRRTERLRLLGVNTPEMQTPTREAGEAAKAYVTRWFALASYDPYPLVVQTVKADAFGRYLADIWRVWDGAHLNAELVEAGHAVRYER